MELDRNHPPEATHKEFVIKGTEEQVAEAERLILARIANDARARAGGGGPGGPGGPGFPGGPSGGFRGPPGVGFPPPHMMGGGGYGGPPQGGPYGGPHGGYGAPYGGRCTSVVVVASRVSQRRSVRVMIRGWWWKHTCGGVTHVLGACAQEVRHKQVAMGCHPTDSNRRHSTTLTDTPSSGSRTSSSSLRPPVSAWAHRCVLSMWAHRCAGGDLRNLTLCRSSGGVSTVTLFGFFVFKAVPVNAWTYRQ